jgi:hypothetical protein
MTISLSYHFNSIIELEEYLNDIKQYEDYKNKKALKKKDNDKRGSHILELHRMAKIYNDEHKELSYKECMKQINIIRKNNKTNKNIIIL